MLKFPFKIFRMKKIELELSIKINKILTSPKSGSAVKMILSPN